MDFSREDIRKIIYYCWKRGLSTDGIHKEINATLGNNTVSIRTCSDWVSKFREGQFETIDKPHPGRPLTDYSAQIEAILDENRHATLNIISQQLSVPKETIRRQMLQMGKRYLSTAWLPHALTDSNRERRMNLCKELLQMHAENNFLPRLITCDETWVYWESSGTHSHRAWRASGDVPTTEVHTNLTTKKHLLTVFWDCKGIILMDVLPRAMTMTAVYYCGLLDRLKTAIEEKRRRRTNDGGLYLLHDNARPHTAVLSTLKLQELGLHVVPHTPYSPDLAPSDYYLFSPLKSALRNQNFDSADAVQQKIQNWLDTKESSFFANGINKLPGRWERCVECHGNYFEHLKDTDE
jgi:[histone H3]-lysine36 N-dimethyltransferase SETMAR